MVSNGVTVVWVRKETRCLLILGFLLFRTLYIGICLQFLLFLSLSSCQVVRWFCFNQQANTTDELPERLIGAVRVSHIELKSAIVPKLDQDPSWLTEVFDLYWVTQNHLFRCACILFHFPLDCHFTWYWKACYQCFPIRFLYKIVKDKCLFFFLGPPAL